MTKGRSNLGSRNHGGTTGTTMESIRAKRRSVTVPRLRSKYQAAPDDYGGGRALVRVGEGMTNVLIGKDDLSTWTDEELRRGRRMTKHGDFRGRDPVIVAKAVHDELVKRTLSEAEELLRTNLNKALQVLVEIMGDDNVDAKDRLRAIEMITSRAMGKEPQKVELEVEAPWQSAIAEAIVSMPDELVDQHAGNRENGDEFLEDEEQEELEA